MDREQVHAIGIYGSVTSLLLCAVILASLYWNPRIWMRGLPKEVQKKLPPKSRREKWQTLLVSILLFTILFVFPSLAVANLAVKPTLPQAFLICYSIYFIFNLTDLFIIDWLIVCTLTPKFIRIKNVDESEYKNYRKHGKDFLKGTVYIALPALISSLVGYLISVM